MSHRNIKRPPNVNRTRSRSVDDNACTVCHETIEFIAIGQCDHPICYKCSTRMRVLCDQLYCAICRADIPKVLYIRKLEKFSNVKLDSFRIYRDKGIFFEDEVIQSAFYKLIENKCKMCQEDENFKTFKELEVHMNRKHERFCCDLCVTNLKLFSCDRKFYERKQLAEHKRLGDLNDTSYRLHPLCRFCDVRYFDNDELLQHLRKDHYYCHFCESDGISNEYFQEYNFLRDHFREKHFLCEEDGCSRLEFVNAFRSEIDLKAHVSTTHSRNLGRQQARQLRSIDVDFDYGTRRGGGGRRFDDRRRGGASGSGGFEDRQGGRNRYGRPDQKHREEQEKRSETDAALALSLSLAEAQGQGSVCIVNPLLAQKSRMAKTDQNSSRAENAEFKAISDDFPLLHGLEKTAASLPAPNVEKEKDSHRPNTGTLAQVLALNTGQSVGSSKLNDAEFPSLVSNKSQGKRVTTSVWNQNGVAPSKSTSNRLTSAEKLRAGGGYASSKRGEFESVTFQTDGLDAANKEVNSKSNISSVSEASLGFHKSRTAPNLQDFPVLGKVPNREQGSATWVKKKENIEPEQCQTNTGKDKLLKLEMKNKGKQKKEVQQVVSKKGEKPEKLNTVCNKTAGASEPGEKQISAAEETKEPVRSLADIAFKLAGNFKMENKGLENDEHMTDLSGSHGTNSFKIKNHLKSEKGQLTSENRAGKPKENNLGKHSIAAKEHDSGYKPDEMQDKRNVALPCKSVENGNGKREKSPVTDVTGSKNNGAKKKKPKPVGNGKDLRHSDVAVGAKFVSGDSLALESEQSSVQKGSSTKSKNVNEAPDFKKPSSVVASDGGFSAASNEVFTEMATSITESGKELSEPVEFVVSRTEDIFSDHASDESKQRHSVFDFQLPCPVSSQLCLDNSDDLPKFLPTDFPSLVKNSVGNLASSENPDGKFSNLTESVHTMGTVNNLWNQENVRGSSLFMEADISNPVVPGLQLAPPPPGFPGTAAKPPPGFASKSMCSKPPPGFSKPLASKPNGSEVDGLDIPNMHNLYVVHPVYVPPKWSQDCYEKLIENILNGNTDITFVRFKSLSLEFRENRIDAKEYYSQCSEVVGASAFRKIFPELVALLPNIEKQLELLNIHRAHVDEESSDPGMRMNSWNIPCDGLIVCSFCGQVVLNDDHVDHKVQHNLDFPECS